MRNLRNFAVLLAVVIGAVRLDAQVNFQGKFQLSSPVRWGKTLLPAGEYSFVIDSVEMPTRVVIHSVNGKAAFLAITSDSASNSPGGSYLVITGTGENRRVRLMNLPQLGRSLVYEPLTRSERETFYLVASQTVPVQIAAK